MALVSIRRLIVDLVKMKKMKTLTTSFIGAARQGLKQFAVEKKLQLRNWANKLYLVSAE
jgi:hypothetical protein